MERKRRNKVLFFYLAFACANLARSAQAGKIEPNDDCLNICDGMCRMCIAFCGFTSDDERDFGACVKNCAALRFSCRMFCEVDYEGESANAFFAPNQNFNEAKKYIGASSSALKQLYRAKLRKARIERQERYDGCAQYCNYISIECYIRACRMWRGSIVECNKDCHDSATNCHQQCRSLYDYKLNFS